MMKVGIILGLFLILLGGALPHVAVAQENSNRFGIHINSEHDLPDAYELVGEGGYVTLVIREDERDISRWSRAFGQIYDFGLIPIVRIATTMEPNGGWRKPELDQADDWARFLNQLPWQDGRRHVVLFNEPNHAKEWGGEIDPSGYASVARAYWEQLKRRSPEFFVLPAGLDQAAPDGPSTMDQIRFMQMMNQHDEYIFSIFDGWNSHSYPNPGFSGHPDDMGRGSIAGYQWELQAINQMGYTTSNLPVYITETGWSRDSLDEATIAEYYSQAFNGVWMPDDRVVAITPFIINYSQAPFDDFSFKSASGEKYAYFSSLKLLADLYNERVLYGPPVPETLDSIAYLPAQAGAPE